MNILLVEDSEKKIDLITTAIMDKCKTDTPKIINARCLTDAISKIASDKFDLIILDFYLPLSDTNSNEQDLSSELINTYNQSINYQTEAIAITQYSRSDIHNIDLFDISGVNVITFEEDKSSWIDSLERKLLKVTERPHFDFLIFCALDKERAAFNKTNASLSQKRKLHGMDCQDISIGDFKGLCITPPRMGLVNMAITCTKAIETFQPKIVSMSGICAGLKDKAKLLDIVVCDTSWEHQTGKVTDTHFESEPYQARMDSDLRVTLKHLADSQDTVDQVKQGLYATELEESEIKVGPVVSGSAVIASGDKMDEIHLQHRKLAALEMEIYSMYEAADQSLSKPKFFAAKSVVDLGDSKKSDHVHSHGCVISARFVETALTCILPDL